MAKTVGSAEKEQSSSTISLDIKTEKKLKSKERSNKNCWLHELDPGLVSFFTKSCYRAIDHVTC